LESLGDVWKMHRMILSGFTFDSDAPGRASVNQLHALRRTDAGAVELLVQSDVPISDEWVDRFSSGSSVERWSLGHVFGAGERVAVRLAAVASRAVKPADGAGRSRRVSIIDHDERLAWFVRRMADSGLAVDDGSTEVSPNPVRLLGRTRSGRQVVADQSVFQ